MMWTYNYAYPNELYHYGVKGMKWGVRHDEREMDARTKYRTAHKEYKKAFNKAYGFSQRHPITQYIKRSKNYKKSNDYWEDAINKAERSRITKQEYKSVKRRARSENNMSSGRARKIAIGAGIAAGILATGLAVYAVRSGHASAIGKRVVSRIKIARYKHAKLNAGKQKRAAILKSQQNEYLRRSVDAVKKRNTLNINTPKKRYYSTSGLTKRMKRNQRVTSRSKSYYFDSRKPKGQQLVSGATRYRRFSKYKKYY